MVPGTNCGNNILKHSSVNISIMMNARNFFNCMLIVGSFLPVFSQTAAEFEANYARRIKMEQINGVYIPIDLQDAFSELNRLSDPQGIAKLKNAPEKSLSQSHFGLQKWIELNWGLDEGSRLSQYLRMKGITVPEDMARVIVLTYHRYLNGKPLMLETEIALINERLKEEKARRDSLYAPKVIDKKPHKG